MLAITGGRRRTRANPRRHAPRRRSCWPTWHWAWTGSAVKCGRHAARN